MSLTDVVRPFATCLPIILNRTALIASCSAIVLIFLRFLFLWTCLDKDTGLPYREDARIFGLLAFIHIRIVTAYTFASRRLWISPAVDFAIMAVVSSTSYVIAWIYQPSISATGYTWKIALPIFTTKCVIICGTVYPLGDGPKFRMWLRAHFKNGLAYMFLVSTVLVGSILCLQLSNTRTHSSSITAENIREDFRNTLLNLIILAVVFPIVRYLSILINKYAIEIWNSPQPTSRNQEIASNISKLVFLVGQETLWGTLGNVMILRSQGYLMFYLGACGYHLAEAIQQLLECAALRRQLKRRVTPTFHHSIAHSDDLEGKVLQFIGARPIHKSLKDGPGMSAFAPGQTGKAPGLKESGTLYQIYSTFPLNQQNESLTTSSPLVKIEGVGEDGGANDSVEDVPEYAHTRVSMVSSECADPFGPDRPPPRLDAIGFTNPSPTETTVSYPIAQESFEPPFSESDTRIAPAQEASKETLTLPFTPLTPQTIYGYHRVGSFIASYTSHYIAFLIVLLFVTLPPYPQWSYNYGHITLPDLMIRAITWPILAALFKCVTCSIEGWWGGVNFKESVEEMRVSGLTGSAVVFVGGLACAGVGAFLVAETAVGFGSDTPVFLLGRKKW